jgi:hypothetical protein
MLHLPDRHKRQRVRLIAERACELLRQLHCCHVALKPMKFAHHHGKITDFYQALWQFDPFLHYICNLINQQCPQSS